MRNCFLKTIQWITPLIAVALLLALPGASARAATLSGTIIDYSDYTHGNYFVYLVRLNLDRPVVAWTMRASAGPWQISGVPNGHFFVLSWRDVNSNFIPSRGEPMGFYGVPFPSRVTVQGGNISGLDVVLGPTNLGAEVTGRITYDGTLTGRIWVVPHTTPDLDITTARGTPYTLTSLGEYTSYILDHGSYYVTAFMDVNGNLLCDDGEPFGITGPVSITVTPGVTYKNIDVHLEDRVMAIEPATWSTVKDLYR